MSRTGSLTQSEVEKRAVIRVASLVQFAAPTRLDAQILAESERLDAMGVQAFFLSQKFLFAGSPTVPTNFLLRAEEFNRIGPLFRPNKIF